MSAAVPVEPRRWRRTRFLAAIAAVFLVQIALICLLSARSSPISRQPLVGPVIDLAVNLPAELLALQDPTAFVLPHRQGFSGEAWLKMPTQQFKPTNWWEPPHWLPPAAQQFGAAFKQFVRTNAASSFQNVMVFEPEPLPTSFGSVEPVAVASMFRVEGDLANRPLLTQWDLGGWTSTELLTNSVVLMLVGPEGNTFCANLLPPGSGSRDADRQAIELARAARFESAAGGREGSGRQAGWTSGTLVFEWETLPLAQTNGTGASQ